MQFSNPYNRQDFIDFFRNDFLPEDFIAEPETIAIEFQSKYFKNHGVTYIGKSDSLDLAVYEIQHTSENDARIGLSRDAFKLISHYFENNALILFVPDNKTNYRLSLVTIEHNLDESGTRVLKTYSNPKRYSYYLGESAKTHTPEQYLIAQGRITDYEDLKRRFSVEVVNKEFYNKIAVMFSKLVGGKRKRGVKTLNYEPQLQLPSHPIENFEQKYKEFAVRLIGRTVFCWFLKKKKSKAGIPLIPEDILSHFAVNMHTDYYHSRVEPLFFEVLNTQTDKRKPEYQQDIYAKIPFLNGGLFEPHHDDYYTNRQANYGLKIPDEWWKAFIEILETYNFTIDENTSIDIDLSVDPEMLGRIFENLLAEINPETGETARKSTGSYYTPRPIVEYMVDESLKQHIITRTNLPEDKIAPLLDYSKEESGLTTDEETKVKTALDDIKVLDPACGSGAFPMGILQKMLLILQKVDHSAENSIKNVLKDIKDPLYRKLFEAKLLDDDDLDDYARKLSIIRRSIYGIDIQPIATEISKLRFFLSIIVDEKIQDDQKNRGIEPLPNLEFKFACANTLIPLPANRELFENADAIEELESLREEYFVSYGDDKKQIKTQFEKIQRQLFTDANVNLFTREVGEHNIDHQTQSSLLATWNPFGDESTPWFDAKWMFGVTNGFDVVIGNPPYIQLQKLKKNGVQDAINKVGYKTFARTGDIYCVFTEKGIKLLKEKGNLVFITNSTWLRTAFGQKLKEYFLKDSSLLKVIDLSDCDLFANAAVLTTIIHASKERIGLKNAGALRIKKNQQDVIFKLSEFYKQNYISLESFKADEAWSIIDRDRFQIKQKVSKQGKSLQKWNIDIFRGILTGYNEAFVIDKAKRDELIEADPKNAEIIKPLVRGKDTKRYFIDYAELYLINTHNGYKKQNGELIKEIIIDHFPIMKDHLDQYIENLIKRSDKGKTPYNLRNCAYIESFFKPKIIYPNMTKNMPFIYDESKCLTNQKCYILTGERLKYLTCIFNSKLFEYCFRSDFPELLGGVVELSKVFFEKVPLKYPNDEQEIKFIDLYNKIEMVVKTDHNEYQKISYQIDLMVYHLYSLTYEEVLLVDPEFGMSKAEYEGVEV